MLLDEAIERLRNLRIGWGNIPIRIETEEGYAVNVTELVRVYDEEYDLKQKCWIGGNTIVIH